MSTVTQQKQHKVTVDQPTKRRIERIAKAQRRKHIDVVGLAIEAYERQSNQNSQEGSGGQDNNVAATTA
jgi:predicted transcriptional regulator